MDRRSPILQFRDAEPSEADALADLWHAGWQDAHAAILPPGLTKYRTLESFGQRVRDGLADVRVAGERGQPLGFSMLKDDELYQFYVAASARGTGVAAQLLADAEQTLRSRGVHSAWLACAMGNQRAARFYSKNGWVMAGNMMNRLPLPDGNVFTLEVWRFEKRLD